MATPFFDTILKIGSLAGLVSLVYQIHNNWKSRPSFKFTFEASGLEKTGEGKEQRGVYHFQGIFRNASLNPNSIVRLYLTVWDSKRRGSVLRYGHNVQKLEEVNTKKNLHLPLRFESKEAMRLLIFFEFPIKGTQDERLLSEYEQHDFGNMRIPFPKHRYEFVVEDVSGNRFDYGSYLMSQDLIDLWWTLPNFSKKPTRYFIHLVKIALAFVRHFLVWLAGLFGFYR